MKPTAVFIVAICCMPVAHAAESSFKLQSEESGEQTYVGRVTLQGELQYDESGEVCLFVENEDLKKVPQASAKARICFVDQVESAKRLGMSDLIKQVDLKQTCGLSGSARVTIDHLVTGMGPSSRWYSARLIAALGKPRLSKEPCNG